MINITLTKDVTYSDGSNTLVTVVPSLAGCTVRFFEQEHHVLWDDIIDMDKLADKFGDTSVRVFKVIVELLGQAYRMKDIVE